MRISSLLKLADWPVSIPPTNLIFSPKGHGVSVLPPLFLYKTSTILKRNLKILSPQSGELTQDELSHLVLGERPRTQRHPQGGDELAVEHDVNRDSSLYQLRNCSSISFQKQNPSSDICQLKARAMVIIPFSPERVLIFSFVVLHQFPITLFSNCSYHGWASSHALICSGVFICF